MTEGNGQNADQLCQQQTQSTRELAPLPMKEFDRAFAALKVAYGVVHGVGLALRSEEHDGESLSHALEYVHESIYDAVEILERLPKK